MINLAKYNEIMETIRTYVAEFERMSFYANTNYLNLANGDNLKIKFPKNNLAHLLGVKLDYLKLSNRLKPNQSSYDLLTSFLDQQYAFSLLVKEGKMNYDSMFSKYISQKLECYNDNIRIRTDDLEYVIKYDHERAFMTSEETDICDYYIVRKKGNKRYVLGLIKGEDNAYLPVTSRVYDDEKTFSDFMKKIAYKQELTYPVKMNVTNYVNDFNSVFTYPDDKRLEMITKIISEGNKYDATPAVASDFFYQFNKSTKYKSNDFAIRGIIDMLSVNMSKGNVLDGEAITSILEEGGLNESVRNLVNTCNDIICHGVNNESAQSNYSELSSENSLLKEELKKYKQLLEEVREQNTNLTEQVTELTTQNECYSQKMTIFEEAYQKVKTLNPQSK